MADSEKKTDLKEGSGGENASVQKDPEETYNKEEKRAKSRDSAASVKDTADEVTASAGKEKTQDAEKSAEETEADDGKSSWNPDTVTWNPILKANTEPFTVTNSDGSTSKWYHVGDLEYTIKLTPEVSTGLSSSSSEKELPEKNETDDWSTLTNQSASLAYKVTDSEGNTLIKDVDF